MSCGICRWQKLLLLFFFFFFFTTDFKEEQQILWIGVEDHNSNTNHPMKLLCFSFGKKKNNNDKLIVFFLTAIRPHTQERVLTPVWRGIMICKTLAPALDTGVY